MSELKVTVRELGSCELQLGLVAVPEDKGVVPEDQVPPGRTWGQCLSPNEEWVSKSGSSVPAVWDYGTHAVAVCGQSEEPRVWRNEHGVPAGQPCEQGEGWQNRIDCPANKANEEVSKRCWTCTEVRAVLQRSVVPDDILKMVDQVTKDRQALSEAVSGLKCELLALRQTIEDYKRDSVWYETAFDEAEGMVKENVQREMASLRAENARLREEVAKKCKCGMTTVEDVAVGFNPDDFPAG